MNPARARSSSAAGDDGGTAQQRQSTVRPRRPSLSLSHSLALGVGVADQSPCPSPVFHPSPTASPALSPLILGSPGARQLRVRGRSPSPLLQPRPLHLDAVDRSGGEVEEDALSPSHVDISSLLTRDDTAATTHAPPAAAASASASVGRRAFHAKNRLSLSSLGVAAAGGTSGPVHAFPMHTHAASAVTGAAASSSASHAALVHSSPAASPVASPAPSPLPSPGMFDLLSPEPLTAPDSRSRPRASPSPSVSLAIGSLTRPISTHNRADSVSPSRTASAAEAAPAPSPAAPHAADPPLELDFSAPDPDALLRLTPSPAPAAARARGASHPQTVAAVTAGAENASRRQHASANTLLSSPTQTARPVHASPQSVMFSHLSPPLALSPPAAAASPLFSPIPPSSSSPSPAQAAQPALPPSVARRGESPSSESGSVTLPRPRSRSRSRSRRARGNRLVFDLESDTDEPSVLGGGAASERRVDSSPTLVSHTRLVSQNIGLPTASHLRQPSISALSVLDDEAQIGELDAQQAAGEDEVSMGDVALELLSSSSNAIANPAPAATAASKPPATGSSRSGLVRPLAIAASAAAAAAAAAADSPPLSPLSPLSPLPGSVHPYARYLARQAPLLHPIPPVSAHLFSSTPPPDATPASAAPQRWDTGFRSALRAARLHDSSTTGDGDEASSFLFVFLDRLIDEGEEFLLYSYPSTPRARRLLSLKGVLSVLEGAVAGVSGQKAELALLEEEDAPRGSTPLRVRAAAVELDGIGQGVAFVALCWNPLVRDAQLRTLTRNVLRTLRCTLGPLHVALFKPWLLRGLSPPGVKPHKFVQQLAEYWRARAGDKLKASDALDSDISQMDPTHARFTATDLERETSTAETCATDATSASEHSIHHFPSDLRWLARQRQRIDVQRAETERARTSALFTDLRTLREAAAPAAQPEQQPSDDSNSAASDPASAPASPPRSPPTPPLVVLCTSYECMSLLDGLFRSVVQHMCQPLEQAVSILAGSDNNNKQLANHALQRAAMEATFAPFLSPSPLVPSSLALDSVATQQLHATCLRIVHAQLARLVQQQQPSASSSHPESPSLLSKTPAVLGAALFHRGRLVHMVGASTTNAGESETSSFVATATPITGTRSLRPKDVHDLANLLTTLGCLPSPLERHNRTTHASRATGSGDVLYAGMHQLWFSYAPNELSESEAEQFRLSTATTTLPSTSTSGPTSRPASSSVAVTSRGAPLLQRATTSVRGGLHARGATVASWNPATAASTSGSNGGSSGGSTASAGPLSTRVALSLAASSAGRPSLSGGTPLRRVRSSSGSNLSKLVAEEQGKEKESDGVGSEPATAPAPLFKPFSDAEVFLPRLVSVMRMGGSSAPDAGASGTEAADLTLLLVMDASSSRVARSLEAIVAEAATEGEQQQDSAAGSESLDPHRAFPLFFSSSTSSLFRARAMHESLSTLYHEHKVHLQLSASVSSPLSPPPRGRDLLQRLAERASSPGVEERSPPVPSPTPHTTTATHACAPSNSVSSSADAAAGHQHPSIGAGLLYDFVLLDWARGVVVRPSVGHAGPLPAGLVSQFHALCARLHGIFARFRPSVLPAAGTGPGGASSAPLLPAAPSHSRTASASLAALSVDAHASREEMGKGNHLYFRRHKSIEALRHVHECGFRLSYGSNGKFWVKGRLLPNGSEVYVCCDEGLPPDVMDDAFKRIS